MLRAWQRSVRSSRRRPAHPCGGQCRLSSEGLARGTGPSHAGVRSLTPWLASDGMGERRDIPLPATRTALTGACDPAGARGRPASLVVLGVALVAVRVVLAADPRQDAVQADLEQALVMRVAGPMHRLVDVPRALIAGFLGELAEGHRAAAPGVGGENGLGRYPLRHPMVEGHQRVEAVRPRTAAAMPHTGDHEQAAPPLPPLLALPPPP